MTTKVNDLATLDSYDGSQKVVVQGAAGPPKSATLEVVTSTAISHANDALREGQSARQQADKNAVDLQSERDFRIAGDQADRKAVGTPAEYQAALTAQRTNHKAVFIIVSADIAGSRSGTPYSYKARDVLFIAPLTDTVVFLFNLPSTVADPGASYAKDLTLSNYSWFGAGPGSVGWDGVNFVATLRLKAEDAVHGPFLSQFVGGLITTQIGIINPTFRIVSVARQSAGVYRMAVNIVTGQNPSAPQAIPGSTLNFRSALALKNELAGFAELAGATFKGVVAGLDPTADTHFATKGYVDRKVIEEGAGGKLEIAPSGNNNRTIQLPADYRDYDIVILDVAAAQHIELSLAIDLLVTTGMDTYRSGSNARIAWDPANRRFTLGSDAFHGAVLFAVAGASPASSGPTGTTSITPSVIPDAASVQRTFKFAWEDLDVAALNEAGVNEFEVRMKDTAFHAVDPWVPAADGVIDVGVNATEAAAIALGTASIVPVRMVFRNSGTFVSLLNTWLEIGGEAASRVAGDKVLPQVIDNAEALATFLAAQETRDEASIVRFAIDVAENYKGVAHVYKANDYAWFPPRSVDGRVFANIPELTAKERAGLMSISISPNSLESASAAAIARDYILTITGSDVLPADTWYRIVIHGENLPRAKWVSSPGVQRLRFTLNNAQAGRIASQVAALHDMTVEIQLWDAETAGNHYASRVETVGLGGGDVANLTNQQKAELLGVRLAPSALTPSADNLKSWRVRFGNPALFGANIWATINISGQTPARQQVPAAGGLLDFALTDSAAESIDNNISPSTIELEVVITLHDAATDGNLLATLRRTVLLEHDIPTVVALVSAAAVAWDTNSGLIADLTLGHNVTLTPTGGLDGATAILRAKQDATGGRTLAFANSVRLGGRTVEIASGANAETEIVLHKIGAAWKYEGAVADE